MKVVDLQDTMRYLSLLFGLLFLTIACHKSQSQTQTLDSTEIEISVVAENLHVPWELVWGPDNHIWFTERNGSVKRLNPDNGSIQNLVTIQAVSETSESGLLGLALDPDFETSPFVYVVYTYSKNGLTERLSRFSYANNTLQNEEVLLDDIPANNNHSGSRIIFLADKTILMSTGDALNTSLSQNENSLAGKMLRINRDGSIPADNPNPQSYVYSLGHRNAQGLVLGPNGMVYSSEHGPNSDDELNIIYRDRNYGWPNVKGYCDPDEQAFCTANNVVEPIMAWTPTLAVAGIDFYNSSAIPEWKNSILLCNLKEDDFRVLKLNSQGTAIVTEEVLFNNQFGRLRAVCVSPDGDVFIASSNRDGRANGGFPRAEDDRIIRISARNQTGLLEHENSERNWFYPNPSEQLVHIALESNESLQVINVLGQIINEIEGPFEGKQIFAAGQYLLRKSARGVVDSRSLVVY